MKKPTESQTTNAAILIAATVIFVQTVRHSKLSNALRKEQLKTKLYREVLIRTLNHIHDDDEFNTLVMEVNTLLEFDHITSNF